MKDLLKQFADDFKNETGIRVTTLEENHLPHWKRLIFPRGLNCEELEKIALFVKQRFYQNGLFAHLAVSLGTYQGQLCLTADVRNLERIYK